MARGSYPRRVLRRAAHRVVLGSSQLDEPIGAGWRAANVGGLRLDNKQAHDHPADHPPGVRRRVRAKVSMILTKRLGVVVRQVLSVRHRVLSRAAVSRVAPLRVGRA